MKHNLMPEPGDYQVPVMQHTRVTGTNDPNVIKLEFAVDRTNTNGTERMTLAVPISVVDAVGMMRTFRILQEKGLLPLIPEGDISTRN